MISRRHRLYQRKDVVENGIDERDSRIIAMLRADPTILNSRISDELGVSNATISARIKKLKEIGLVRVVGSTNINVAGFSSWVFVSAQFAPGKNDSCESVAARLEQMPQVTAIASQQHNEQIMFHLIGRDAADVDGLLTDIAASIPAIKHLNARFVLSNYKRTHNSGPIVNIVPDFDRRLRELSETRLQELLGERELAVLAMLHGDGRMSLREVARRLDYPESQVRSIFRKLENTPGMLNYQTIVDPRSLANPYQCELYIKASYRYLPDILKTLTARPEVSGLATITGSQNLAVTVGTPSRNTLQRTVAELVPAMEGVLETEVISLHRGFKFDGSWTIPVTAC